LQLGDSDQALLDAESALKEDTEFFKVPLMTYLQYIKLQLEEIPESLNNFNIIGNVSKS
jgi:hypothetical protein